MFKNILITMKLYNVLILLCLTSLIQLQAQVKSSSFSIDANNIIELQANDNYVNDGFALITADRPPTFEPILDKPQYQAGQLYLKMNDDAAVGLLFKAPYQPRNSRLHNLIDEFGITEISYAFERLLPEMQKYYRIRFDNVNETQALIRALQDFRFVEFVEQVPMHYKFLTPNDINANQYNVLITQAEAAWDITTGNANVVIGMVDDAVLLDHEDLAANIWVNSGEIAGNGVDDDGNGYIDDINGWDAADNDNDPNPPAADNFTFSHGTHCAGIAAGVTDNGVGVASVSFNVSQMAVKIADDATEALSGAMGGVEYAIAAGADVISMSWGGGAPSATEQAVFNTANAQGITLIAAAGNDNTDALMYPASYEFVISVGATDDADLRAGFTNYGDSIDVMAPGVNIYSPVATNNSAYEFYDGTSMACPYVSGLAALMLSLDPTLTPARIEECLETTADDIYPLNPDFIGQLGAGRVNAHQAVLCVPTEPLAGFTTDFVGTACAGQPVTFTDISGGIDLDSWTWSFPGATPSSSTDQNPTVIFPSNGTYNVTLTVTNYLGTDTYTETITIAEPTATLSGDTLLIAGYPTFLEFNFTGTPPWNFVYTDGTDDFTITGITETPYIIQVFPNENTTYEITTFNDSFCSGIASGDAEVVVDLALDDPNSPFYLVQNVLLGGSCLSAFNVQFIGSSQGLGYFEQGPNLNIGFTDGVALTTGVMEDLIYAPNDGGGATEPFTDCGGGFGGCPGDPDLDIIIPGFTTNDAVVLEFDFVPSTDNISFNYVFASEEYNEYVCSNFNDVFAFLLSGPGIAGGEGLSNDATNIALVPGTTTPVAINTVNNGGGFGFPGTTCITTNDAYYIDNEANFAGNETQFDGYTVTLTAEYSGLTPCETYHIKLAIADAGDAVLDSGVFLEAGSFSDGSEITVSAEGVVPGTVEVYEGCPTGQFVIERQDLSTLDTDITYDISIGGNAIPDIDYLALPSQVTIPAGDTSIVLPLIAYQDGMVEAPEVVVILFDDIECGCTETSLSATLIIFDNTEVDAGEPAEICPGESATLSASGGSSYNWTPNDGTISDPTTATPTVSPDESTWYVVEATDQWGCTSIDSVFVFIYNTPYFEPVVLDTTICSAETAIIELNTVGTPISNYDYTWTPATGLDNPNQPNPTATLDSSIDYILEVTNPQGCSVTQEVSIVIEEVSVAIDLENVVICPGESISLDAGDGYAAYEWSTGENTQSITVTEAGDYEVVITDATFGCNASATVTVSEQPAPAPTITGDLSFETGGSTTLDAGNGYSSYLWNTADTTQTILVDVEGDYSVTVSNEFGCTGESSVTVSEIIIIPPVIAPYAVPSAFSPNNDGVNDEFRVIGGENIESVSLIVYNRWGERVFESNDLSIGWNGTYKAVDCEMGTYVYFGKITLVNGDVEEINGNVTLIR